MQQRWLAVESPLPVIAQCPLICLGPFQTLLTYLAPLDSMPKGSPWSSPLCSLMVSLTT